MSQKPECEAVVDSSLGQELEKDECQVLADVMGVRKLKDGEVLVKKVMPTIPCLFLSKGSSR